MRGYFGQPRIFLRSSLAAMSIVSGVLLPPLPLLNGFKRGENGILREGRRVVVMTGRDAAIKVATTPE